MRKFVTVLAASLSLVLLLSLCACGAKSQDDQSSNNTDSNSSVATNSSNSAKPSGNSASSDEYIQVNKYWSYKNTNDNKTEFKRVSDGYTFTVDAKMATTSYSANANKEEATSVFGTARDSSDVMSMTVYNNFNSIQSTVKAHQSSAESGTEGVIQSGNAKAYWKAKYSATNTISFYIESEDLYIEAICGSALLEDESAVKAYVDRFHF